MFEGCPLAWRLDGAGPPLIMIEGTGSYGTSANPLIDRLQKRYTCLSFDNRGLGASQPAGKKLTVRQMARDALALMTHTGWESAHLVGHSLGGLAALETALVAKPRIRSLTLLNTFARGSEATRMTPKIVWILVRLRFGSRSVRRDAFLELVVPPGYDGDPKQVAETLSGVFGHDIADLPEAANLQLKAMNAHDLTGKLSQLEGIPTLVISGEKDLIARPELGRAIAAEIPGARYVEFPGASHALPVLEADRCAALILEHLDNAEQTRAA